jgi:hypothetical protein
MASKPGIVTVAASAVTVTWGGSQAGSTVPTGSWATRSLRSASIPPLLLLSGPLRVPSRRSCLPSATNPATVKVPLKDSSLLPPAAGTVPPGSGPTVVARALAVVHTAMYDAWAAYDATAVGTRLGGSLRRPPEERTAAYKSKAISYAAYRALLDLFPTRAGDLTGETGFMAELGYDPADTSVDPTTPQGIGNLTAQAVLDFRHRDGANQLGDEPGGTPAMRYSGWTGYAPVNTWDQVNDPYRW